MDTATGIFTFETQITGEFTIVYVDGLARLSLNLNSLVIYDLAANTPTQHMDVLPIIEDGRVLVPLRFVANALGAGIDWSNATDDRPLTIYITTNGGETISFGIGEITPELAALGMDVPAQLNNGRTMVPMRFSGVFRGCCHLG